MCRVNKKIVTWGEKESENRDNLNLKNVGGTKIIKKIYERLDKTNTYMKSYVLTK